MSRSIRGAAVVALAAVVAGCGPAPEAPEKSAAAPMPALQTELEAADLAGTEWVATTIQGEPVGEEIVSTMSFDAEGGVSGSAGCNRYFGSYAMEGDAIAFGHLGATQMMCPPEQMAREDRFLDAVARAARVQRRNGTLTLSSAEGGEVMVLSEVEPSPLVTGSVLYRERMALPPEATLTVRLVDVSRADAPAVLLGEQVITPTGQVPIPFEIAYDPAQIDERMSYAVQARIEAGGELMFITTQHFPVITRGNPSTDLEIVLERVGGS